MPRRAHDVQQRRRDHRALPAAPRGGMPVILRIVALNEYTNLGALSNEVTTTRSPEDALGTMPNFGLIGVSPPRPERPRLR